MFPGGATSGVQPSGTANPGETEAQPMSKLLSCAPFCASPGIAVERTVSLPCGTQTGAQIGNMLLPTTVTFSKHLKPQYLKALGFRFT